MERVEAKAPWVAEWGYSRAVRSGSLIEVGGTTAALASGEIVGEGDLYAQTAHVLRAVMTSVEELGGTVQDVVRTRVFLRHIDDWHEAGRAHLEVFGIQLPASSCIGGAEFLDARLLVEVELTAVVAEHE